MTDKYVDGLNGNDSNSGNSEALAWKTLAKAFSWSDGASFGSTVFIKNSVVYNEKISVTLSKNAQAARFEYVGYATTPGDNGKVTVTGDGSRDGWLYTDGAGGRRSGAR